MKKRKGVALIWTLILSTILIITSTTMVSYIIKDSQFSVRIEESTQVYATAKSAAEWGKWYLSENGVAAVGTYNFNLLTDNEDNETQVVIAGLTGGGYGISSETTANGVTRKLRYNITNNPGVIITPKPIVNDTFIGQNSESFDLQFDLWTKSDHPFSFGLQNPGSSNKIFARLDSASGELLLGNSYSGTTTSSEGIFNIYNDSVSDKPYIYRVNLKYIKDTAAKLTIKKRDSLSGEYLCGGSTNIDLTGMNFGDLSNLYAYTSSGSVSYLSSGGSEGDGNYILIKSSTSTYGNYIDNIYIKR